MSKGHDGIPRQMSSSYVCFPKEMMACHDRHHLSMYAVQGWWWYATYEVDRQCVLSKVYDYMSRQMFNCEWCLRSMIACHAEHCPTVCIVERLRRHATPIFVLPCVLRKGDDVLLCLTLFDHVYFPRAMMESLARHRSLVCVVQGRWWHPKHNVVWLFCFPKVMMAFHAWYHLSLCEV